MSIIIVIVIVIIVYVYYQHATETKGTLKPQSATCATNSDCILPQTCGADNVCVDADIGGLLAMAQKSSAALVSLLQEISVMVNNTLGDSYSAYYSWLMANTCNSQVTGVYDCVYLPGGYSQNPAILPSYDTMIGNLPSYISEFQTSLTKFTSKFVVGAGTYPTDIAGLTAESPESSFVSVTGEAGGISAGIYYVTSALSTIVGANEEFTSMYGFPDVITTTIWPSATVTGAYTIVVDDGPTFYVESWPTWTTLQNNMVTIKSYTAALNTAVANTIADANTISEHFMTFT